MQFAMQSRIKAFTLIELLVVISIIALLSSVVMAAVTEARNKARAAKAQSDMITIIKAISVAQGERNQALRYITGTTWSVGPCQVETGVYNMSTTACYNSIVAALTAIQNATNGAYPNLTRLARDPWGNAYYLDENQGESDCSATDTFRSAGPDGMVGTGYNDDNVLSPIAVPLAAKCP